MPADINIDDLTNSGGTGIFDKLMNAINDNINTQYENNRISGSDYANVYLGSMQAALAQSVQFLLQEQVTEAQIDDIRAGNLLKDKQLEISEQELALKKAQADKEYAAMLAYIDKEIGFDYTLDVDNNLVRSSLVSASDGKLDFEVANLQKQGVLLDTEEEIKQYQATSVLPVELKLLEQKVVGKKQAEVIGE